MIKIYNVVLKDGLTDCPFVPNKKEGLFSWIPVVGDVLDGLVDDILGVSQTNSTNEANRQIATENREATKEANATNVALQRETNDLQYKMFNEQNAFTEDMWNKQNEYNDPKKQVERMLAAGINPAGVTSTPAGSVSSASAPSLGSPRVIPETLDYQNLQNPQRPLDLIGAFFSNQFLNSQIKEKDVDTGIKSVQLQFEAAKNMSALRESMARVNEALANAKVGTAKYENLMQEKSLLELNVQLYKDTLEDMKKHASLQNDFMQTQMDSISQDIILKKIDAYWKPVMNSVGVKLSEAQAKSLLDNLQLIAPQIELMAAQGKLHNANAVGKIIENGMNAIDYQNKSELQGIYNGNKLTRKGKNAFYMLGDILFSQMRGVFKH